MDTDTLGLLLGLLVGLIFVGYLGRHWPGHVKILFKRCPRFFCFGKIENVSEYEDKQHKTVESLVFGGMWHTVIVCRRCSSVWAIESSPNGTKLTRLK